MMNVLARKMSVALVCAAPLIGCTASAPKVPEGNFGIPQPKLQFVASAMDAIRIASQVDRQQFRNEGIPESYEPRHWYAALENGIWHVWTTNDPDEACAHWPIADRCPAYGYEIAQANGRTRGKAYMGDVEY
jgi:hypothetical protein